MRDHPRPGLAIPERHRARMLLRLLAALTVVNVLDASEVLQLLEAVLHSAVSIAQAGGVPSSSVIDISYTLYPKPHYISEA